MFWKKVSLLTPLIVIDTMLWCFSFVTRGDAAAGYAVAAALLLIPIVTLTQYIIENVR